MSVGIKLIDIFCKREKTFFQKIFVDIVIELVLEVSDAIDKKIS